MFLSKKQIGSETWYEKFLSNPTATYSCNIS